MTGNYKREALFGYRLRFSPEFQPIRQTVIDHMILGTIQNFEGAYGPTIGKLNQFSVAKDKELALNLDETRASLRRLEKVGLVETKEVKRKTRWFLTDHGQSQLRDSIQYASTVESKVADSLFPTHSNRSEIMSAFLEALGIIFEEITASYIEALFSNTNSPVEPDLITIAAISAHNSYPRISADTIASAITRFFRDSNPEFDWVKWTFCKNYYAVRAMGLGQGSHILSSTLFRDATFYLDTNVLIDALDTDSSRHLMVRQSITGLSRIGCKLALLRITVTEFQDLARNLQGRVARIFNQIPDELLSRVDSYVARAEARHRADPSEPSPETLLNHYAQAAEVPLSKLGLEVVDDEWFSLNVDNEEIVTLADRLREHYGVTAAFSRSKSGAAALHDALALTFIARTDRAGEGSSHFLTVDYTLPNYKPATLFDGLELNRAVRVDALLPWLGAVDGEDESTSRALSAALSNQLVPTRGGFSLNDFRLLAEAEMDCKHMPAEDVEQCIAYLRREATGLNTALAEDRETLNGLVRGFFASPERKYLADVNHLRNELDASRSRVSQERQARRKEQERVQSLERKLRDQDLRRRASNRLFLSLAVFLVLTAAGLILADRYGSGENLLQQVGSVWYVFTIISALTIMLARWLCRGKLWSVAKEIFGALGK